MLGFSASNSFTMRSIEQVLERLVLRRRGRVAHPHHEIDLLARTTRAPRVARALLSSPPVQAIATSAKTRGSRQLPRAPHQHSLRFRSVTTTPPNASGAAAGPGPDPRASASATAIRCITISSAIGSSSPATTVAPVAAAASSTPPSTLAERPHDAPRPGHADRPVSVLHRRVRLGPRLGRLAQLERCLVRQSDGPSHAQEYEVVERRGLDRQRRLEGAVPRRRSPGPRSWPRLRAQERQRARREPRLYHRALVGELERDDLVGRLGDGGVRDARRSRRGADPAVARGSRTTSVVVPLREIATTVGVRAIEPAHLGGGEGVRLPVPERSRGAPRTPAR